MKLLCLISVLVDCHLPKFEQNRLTIDKVITDQTELLPLKWCSIFNMTKSFKSQKFASETNSGYQETCEKFSMH